MNISEVESYSGAKVQDRTEEVKKLEGKVGVISKQANRNNLCLSRVTERCNKLDKNVTVIETRVGSIDAQLEEILNLLLGV